MSFKKFYVSLTLVVVTFTLAQMVFADGGMIPKVFIGNPPESPNQRAVIFHENGKETMILQVKYKGDAKDFSWIIPLPALPRGEDIRTAEGYLFEELYWVTQPCIAYGQFGDNVTDLGKAGVDRETRVKVWEQLTVGPYDVSIISGTDSNALIKWLNENEYLITDAAQSIIGFYVQKGWYFVALKISLEATSDTTTALKPIKISFDSTQPIYPLKISSISSSELAEILIYVITKDHKMVASNFNTLDVDVDSLIEAILITDYETWFKEQLSQFGEPAFIVEYSDYVRYWRLYSLYEEFPQMKETEEPYFLTRFRTYISPEQMDDVVFEKDPSGDKAFSVVLNWLDGDMDKDGRLTALDGLIAQRIAIGYDKPTYFHREVGDVYPEDSKITKYDVITILSRSVGLW